MRSALATALARVPGGDARTSMLEGGQRGCQPWLSLDRLSITLTREVEPRARRLLAAAGYRAPDQDAPGGLDDRAAWTEHATLAGGG